MKGLNRPSRQLIRLYRSHSLRQQAPTPLAAVQRCRYRSSVSNGSLPRAASIDIEAIRAEMLARPPQVHMDMMNPINSHHLTRALSEFLPEKRYTDQRTPFKLMRKDGGWQCSYSDGPRLVPAGHHLVYFPLQQRGSDLCPDGTDPYHSPRDTPFTRRMWAGGSIRGFRNLALDERLAFCLERIVDVSVRGPAGAEKIFVEVLRQYATFNDICDMFGEDLALAYYDLAKDTLRPASPFRDPGEYDLEGITERRTLVFMREPSDEEKKVNLEKEQRIVKAPTKPDYSVTLTPTPTLLFHYSALTYNAHRIHLDRSYCREAEGYRDLLVHGPLSLTLMLSVLQSRLKTEHESIDNINYRHLAPLYVGQPMRICLRLQKPRAKEEKSAGDGDTRSKARKSGRSDAAGEIEVGRNKWDLWVENQDGSLCVSGTAETVKHELSSAKKEEAGTHDIVE
ncbi:hypothetical protein F4801DRAFT_547157 [Xylaria longipes]|nr:hypothetical protein F4801DRAFT_547157 [Xylaria longipes]